MISFLHAIKQPKKRKVYRQKIKKKRRHETSACGRPKGFLPKRLREQRSGSSYIKLDVIIEFRSIL